MNKSLKLSLNLFWQLLKTDIYIHKQTLIDECINITFWLVSSLLIFAYIYPRMGMQESFGAFFAIGGIAAYPFWCAQNASTTFLADMEGNQTIAYFFTLPIKSYFVVIKQMLGYALKTVIPSLFILPLSKLILWNKIDFSHFSFFKFILIFCMIQLFCGAFSLFVASLVKNLMHLDKIGIRILFPMWFLGCSNFSWFTLNQYNSLFAKLCLLNPLIYTMEGIHAAVLGQEGYLSFYLCLGMLFFFTILFAVLAIIYLKKRLDFV